TEQYVYSFDALDRLITSTNYDNKTISYTYAMNGNKTSLTDPDGITTLYTYDAQNRLTTVTTESGVTTYAYWPDGLVKSITYPNGAIADTSFADSYDSAGRLTYLVNHFGTAGVVPSASQLISSFQYSYDRDGNRLTQTEIHPWLNAGQPETTTYGYDGLNRLTSVSYYNDATLTYTYDADGNRLTEKGTDPTTRNPVSLNYVYNALNELTSVTNTLDASQDVTYTYDANGNRTTMSVGSSNTPYFYNILDQLVKTTQTSGG